MVNKFFLSLIKSEFSAVDFENIANMMSQNQSLDYLNDNEAILFAWNKMKKMGLPIIINSMAFRKFAIETELKRKEIARFTNKINSVLKDNEIPVLFCKGIPYEYMIYGQKVGRYIGDIDILVPEKHLKQTNRLLMELGFEVHNNIEGSIAPITITTAEKLYTRHIVFLNGLCMVEVHRQLHHFAERVIMHADESQIYFESFYKNHVYINNDEVHDIPTLDECDSLMVLCNHAFNEQRLSQIATRNAYTMKYYIDIYHNAKRIEELNLWGELYERSDRYNFRLAIGTLLTQIAELFDWNSSKAFKLFVTDEIYENKNHISLRTEKLNPVALWRKPFKERFFCYGLDDIELFLEKIPQGRLPEPFIEKYKNN